jgi:hypothetical protein
MSNILVTLVTSTICLVIEIIFYSTVYYFMERIFGISSTSFLIIMILVKSQCLRFDIIGHRDRIEKLEREVIK